MTAQPPLTPGGQTPVPANLGQTPPPLPGQPPAFGSVPVSASAPLPGQAPVPGAAPGTSPVGSPVGAPAYAPAGSSGGAAIGVNGQNPPVYNQPVYGQPVYGQNPYGQAVASAPQPTKPANPFVGSAFKFGLYSGLIITAVLLVAASILGILLKLSAQEVLTDISHYSRILSIRSAADGFGFMGVSAFVYSTFLGGGLVVTSGTLALGGQWAQVSIGIFMPLFLLIGAIVSYKIMRSALAKSGKLPVNNEMTFWLATLSMWGTLYIPYCVVNLLAYVMRTQSSLSSVNLYLVIRGSFLFPFFFTFVIALIFSLVTLGFAGFRNEFLIKKVNQIHVYVAPAIFTAIRTFFWGGVCMTVVCAVYVLASVFTAYGNFKVNDVTSFITGLVMLVVMLGNLLLLGLPMLMFTPLVVNQGTQSTNNEYNYLLYGIDSTAALLFAILAFLLLVVLGVVIRHRVRGFDNDPIMIAVDAAVFAVFGLCAMAFSVINCSAVQNGVSKYSVNLVMLSPLVIFTMAIYGAGVAALHVFLFPLVHQNNQPIRQFVDKLALSPAKGLRKYCVNMRAPKPRVPRPILQPQPQPQPQPQAPVFQPQPVVPQTTLPVQPQPPVQPVGQPNLHSPAPNPGTLHPGAPAAPPSYGTAPLPPPVYPEQTSHLGMPSAPAFPANSQAPIPAPPAPPAPPAAVAPVPATPAPLPPQSALGQTPATAAFPASTPEPGSGLAPAPAPIPAPVQGSVPAPASGLGGSISSDNGEPRQSRPGMPSVPPVVPPPVQD